MGSIFSSFYFPNENVPEAGAPAPNENPVVAGAVASGAFDPNENEGGFAAVLAGAPKLNEEDGLETGSAEGGVPNEKEDALGTGEFAGAPKLKEGAVLVGVGLVAGAAAGFPKLKEGVDARLVTGELGAISAGLEEALKANGEDDPAILGSGAVAPNEKEEDEDRVLDSTAFEGAPNEKEEAEGLLVSTGFEGAPKANDAANGLGSSAAFGVVLEPKEKEGVEEVGLGDSTGLRAAGAPNENVAGGFSGRGDVAFGVVFAPNEKEGVEAGLEDSAGLGDSTGLGAAGAPNENVAGG